MWSLWAEPGSPLKQERVEASPAYRCRSPVRLTKKAARSKPRLAGFGFDRAAGTCFCVLRSVRHSGSGHLRAQGMPTFGRRRPTLRPCVARTDKRLFLSSTGRGAFFLFGQAPKRKNGGAIRRRKPANAPGKEPIRLAAEDSAQPLRDAQTDYSPKQALTAPAMYSEPTAQATPSSPAASEAASTPAGISSQTVTGLP